MSVDAGSISSSVRIKLDQLNADIAACKTAFDQLGGNLAASAANYSNITGKQYAAALKKIQSETDNITAAAKAGALSQQQATAKLIQLRQQELAILQKRAISEAGSNKATIEAIKNTESGLKTLIEKQKLLGKETNNASSIAKGFGSVLGALGISFSAAAIINGLKQCVTEFMNAQEIAQRFDLALKMNGMESAKKGLSDLADQLQATAGFDGDYIKQLELQLVTEGRTEKQIKDLIIASAGLSSVYGDDLGTNLEQLSKMLEGIPPRTASLKAATRDLTTEQLKNGEGLKIIKERYEGFIGQVGTMKTSVKSLKEGFGDFAESIGSSTNGFDNVMDWYAKGFKNLANIIDEATKKEKIDRLLTPMLTQRTNMTKLAQDMAKYGITWGDSVKYLTEKYQKLQATQEAFGDRADMSEEINQTLSLLSFARDKASIEAAAQKAAEKAAEEERKAGEQKKKNEEDNVESLEAEKARSAERLRIYNEEQKAFEDAMAKSRDRYKETEKQIQLLGKNEKEQQDLKRKWEIEAIQRADITDEQKAAEIAKLNILYAKQDELAKADAAKKLAESAQDYQDKLDALNGVVKDQIAVERERALKLIDNSGASADEMDKAREAVNAYFDALEKSKGPEEFAKNLKKISSVVGEVSGFIKDLLGSIDDAVQASYDKMVDAAEESAKAQEKAMDARHDSETEALDAESEHKLELLENDGLTKEQALQKQVEDAIAAGDAEAQKEAEKQLLIYQTQEEYAAKQKALKDQQAAEDEAREKQAAFTQADLEYRAALASWNTKMAIAITDGIAAVINAIATTPGDAIIKGIAGAATGVLVGVQVAAISKTKPTPPKLATGGIILPQSGGVPTIQAENGYPELSLNGGPSGMAVLDAFAAKTALAIQRNGGGKSSPQTVIIQIPLNGKVLAEVTAEIFNNGQVVLR